MDLHNESLDLFTQRLMERTKARSEDLDQMMSETGIYTSLRKRPSPLREDNSPRKVDSFEGKRPCRTSPQKAEKSRKSVSFSDQHKQEKRGVESKENKSANLKGRLQKIAAFHSSSDESIDSPPPKPARLYPDLTSLLDDDTNMSPPKSRGGTRRRLAELASSYKQLEDEPLKEPRRNERSDSNRSSKSSSSSAARTPATTKHSLSPVKRTPSNQSNRSSHSASPCKNSPVKSSPTVKGSSTTTNFSKALEKFQSNHTTTTTQAASSGSKSPNSKSKESQGYVHSPSKSKLEYDFKQQQQTGLVQQKKEELTKKAASKSTSPNKAEKSGKRKSGEFKIPQPPPPPPQQQTTTKTYSSSSTFKDSIKTSNKAVVERKTNQKNAPGKISFNPADIKLRSVAESETSSNNKPVITRCHPKISGRQDPAELPISARVALFEQASQAEAEAAASSRFVTGVKRRTTTSPVKQPQQQQQKSPTKQQADTKLVRSNSKVGKATEAIHRKLFDRTAEWKENEIAAKLQNNRQKEMKALLNRWEKAGEEDAASSEDSRRRSVTSVTSSELENLESSDYENESEAGHEGAPEPHQYGTDETDETEQEETREEEYESRDEEEDDTGSEDVDVSALLDEALDDESAFSYESDASSVQQPSSSMQRKRSETRPYPLETARSSSCRSETYSRESMPPPKPPHIYPTVPDYSDETTTTTEDEQPLLHSVSFYRRQQKVKSTPVKKIVRDSSEESVKSPSPQKMASQVPLKSKIKALQEEVQAQQIIISQTSQALNLCRASSEFFGSLEQVEGERLLLIATHKRMAAMNEIQRLKMESVASANARDSPATSGMLSLKEIELPLKREFLRQSENGRVGEFVHFFICLIKHGPQVIATQMVSTMDGISGGALHVPNLINVRDLDCCFDIAFEVYGLQTRRDQVAPPAERMKSMKKEKSKMSLTPKKKGTLYRQDPRSVQIQSPGGPSAVRTSSFLMIGFTHLNVKTLKRRTWVLEKVPFISPLEGSLNMKIGCVSDYHVEEKGFLTMFEDVSGFGAWHRRWCVLKGTYLSYWRYPDEENRKTPIGSMDLRNCVTSNVGLVARDICARPNTFMLLTVRPPEPHDSDTLISQTHGTYTSIKHLLSADTREERIFWCDVLNTVLSNIRMWDPEALRPFDLSPSDSEDY